MKRLLSLILLLFAFFCFSFVSPVLAEGDVANGGKVFTANCAACHAGGGNLVAGASKGLTKDALDKNGVNTLEKIVYQVTNGKGAMPAFKGRLDAQKIEDVATYVLSQAEAGW